MGRTRLPKGTTKAERNAERAAIKSTPRRGEEELSIYASGDGSLSFVWQADEIGRGRIATGRKVTIDDAMVFMGTSRRGLELTQDGWRLWMFAGEPHIIAPVERTGPDTIKMGDSEYRYTIDQTDPFYIRDGDVRQVSLRLEILDEKFAGLPIELLSVKNCNTLASAAFFLNHEKALAANPPESLTYQLA